MRKLSVVHRGSHPATGFIIDVPMIGLAEARMRSLELLGPGGQLLALADGRWLLLTKATTLVRTDRAPGVVLVGLGGEICAAPGLRSEKGLVEYRHGRTRVLPTESLPAVDLSVWFDLGPVIELHPVEAASVPSPSSPALPPRTDLRAAARVKDPSAATKAAIREFGALPGPSNGGRPRTSRAGKGAAGQAAPRSRPLRDAFARRVMRSPAGGIIGRRHAKYVEQLTRQFESGDLEEALHRAIPLGDGLSAALSLKLPQRRSQLQISRGGTANRSVPYGVSVHQHLRSIYRTAAQALEQRREIDQAAFVLGELLRDTTGCVAMLERHQRFETAASIAEQRGLDAPTVVRLWWLAKNRDRAIAVARRHRAFAAAITRLEMLDPDSALALRTEWANELERAGDLVGAVEAAWPKPGLRVLLINVIGRGEELGGAPGGVLRAYGLALKATDERINSAIELLTSNREFDNERMGFISAFAIVAASTDDADKRIASSFLRANPVEPAARPNAKSDWYKIRDRADAALVADLPTARRQTLAARGPVHLPRMPAGQLPLADAAGLPNGNTLVALGPYGCRLIRSDSSTVARWHVPTSKLVIADHGGSALLLDERASGEVDVRRLDLTTRRLSYYGTLRLQSFADSFDGTQWLVIDQRNAAIMDMTAATPEIAWRPLESAASFHSILRTQDQITALVSVGGTPISPHVTELRAWDASMSRLTKRTTVTFADDVGGYQLLPGELMTVRGANLEISQATSTTRIALETGERILVAGQLIGRLTSTDDGQSLRVERWPGQEVVILYDVSDHQPTLGVRSSGGMATVWDTGGRVHVVDLNTTSVVASARTRL